MRPARACSTFPLAGGVLALPGGFALLEASRVLLCADAHLGYEDVMGGGAGLPLWSTHEIVAAIALAARRYDVAEIVLLGDAVHGVALSEGAARAVRAGLGALRDVASLTIVAGNHEGPSRGVAVLGETVERCERDGWALVHGDRPLLEPGTRCAIGHLHPSVHLAGDVSAPAFIGSARLVVVPALTPYSTGLDVTGEACLGALAAWDVRAEDAHVVATGAERIFPFGSLSSLRSSLRRHGTAGAEPLGPRRRLRASE